MLFAKRFLFFPPVEADSSLAVLDFLLAQNTPPVALWACRLRFFTAWGIRPHFISGVCPTADFITCRGKQSFPLQPPTHLKCSFLGLRLGVKAIRATHMQLRTIITVLDFLLAQNTPPVALWACRLRFFTAWGIHPHFISGVIPGADFIT